MELEVNAPICPHCSAKIHTVNRLQMGTHLFYLCPKCDKILSIEKA